MLIRYHAAMILHQRNRIRVRRWADVFRPHDEIQVYHKLFKKLAADIEGQAIRRMFGSECRAFELVLGCPDIAHYVPPLKRVVVERVVDEQGCDVSDDYLLDCCYSTGVAVGRETEAVAIIKYPWGKTLAARLEELGIDDWEDGSVFLNDDKSSGVLIDITTTEHRSLYPNVFAKS